MLFNSIEFLLFLPTVFVLYWFLFQRNLRLQNLLVVFASYVFYGWWDWRFLGLIFLSTLVDYIAGRALGSASDAFQRKLWLGVSITVNLGLLGFLKYWGFLSVEWVEAWASVGVTMNVATWNIILPVGISFYTFQTLSYTIDVYRRNMEPTRDFIGFAAFVAFFPQLVAGPIERATNLLPQFSRARTLQRADAVEGGRQILWGMFKKVVIADQLAVHVDQIFMSYQSQPGVVLVLGAIFFAFQIYCDFSGYSDMAIGTARLFGFKLMTNFRYPYFARDIAEFWRRWHISLSTWFRDYLYIPLGGSRGGLAKTFRNVMVIFVVSGFWHGANWTFIVWGALHAMFFLPLLIAGKNRRYLNDAAEGSVLPGPAEAFSMALTFSAACFAWIFFRAESVGQAADYSVRIFTQILIVPVDWTIYAAPILLLVAFVGFEWAGRQRPFPLSQPPWPKWVLRPLYFILFYWTIIVSQETSDFIYFQF